MYVLRCTGLLKTISAGSLNRLQPNQWNFELNFLKYDRLWVSLKRFDFRNIKLFFLNLRIVLSKFICILLWIFTDAYENQNKGNHDFHTNESQEFTKHIFLENWTVSFIVTYIILYLGYFQHQLEKIICKMHLLQNSNVYFTDRYFIWQSNFHFKDVIYCSVKLLGTFSGWNLQVTNLWHNNLCSRIWYLSSFLKIQKEKSTPF